MQRQARLCQVSSRVAGQVPEARLLYKTTVMLPIVPSSPLAGRVGRGSWYRLKHRRGPRLHSDIFIMAEQLDWTLPWTRRAVAEAGFEASEETIREVNRLLYPDTTNMSSPQILDHCFRLGAPSTDAIVREIERVQRDRRRGVPSGASSSTDRAAPDPAAPESGRRRVCRSRRRRRSTVTTMGAPATSAAIGRSRVRCSTVSARRST